MQAQEHVQIFTVTLRHPTALQFEEQSGSWHHANFEKLLPASKKMQAFAYWLSVKEANLHMI